MSLHPLVLEELGRHWEHVPADWLGDSLEGDLEVLLVWGDEDLAWNQWKLLHSIHAVLDWHWGHWHGCHDSWLGNWLGDNWLLGLLLDWLVDELVFFFNLNDDFLLGGWLRGFLLRGWFGSLLLGSWLWLLGRRWFLFDWSHLNDGLFLLWLWLWSFHWLR